VDDGVARWFGEGHVVQFAQAVAWGVALIVALATSWRRPTAGDRTFAVWQGLVALVALLRELDLHERLQALGPIHFRSRWLLEAPVSVWWKGAIVGGGLALAGALVAPPLALGIPWRALLRRRDRVAWLVVACLACLAAGYAIDDILARLPGVDRSVTKPVEEGLELIGALAFWASVERERRDPLSRRLPAAGRG
jgi:hypothetical protein